MRFRQNWMWVIVIGVLLGSSGCGLLEEGGDRTAVPAAGRQDQAETAAPGAEGICGEGQECQATAAPDGSRDGFTWFCDCSEAGCSATGEGIPVGFIPVSCSEWPCPTQNCGEGEEYEATCPPAPTCAPGQTCYHGGPVMAVPIPGWGSIECESTPAATSNIETAPITPNGADASTPTPTCDPGTGDGGVAATPTPTSSTVRPKGSATLTPTPYTFATNCGACMPTEIPDYDYINTWDEFTTLLNHYIEKYVYFPVTVYHRVNESEFIALWGDADNYNQVVWVQLQKDGSQRTDDFYPGMRVMVYAQISLDQGCTDDLSAGAICFPAVIGSSVAER